MKFLLILATLIMLATVRGDKDAKDSQLSMVLVKALQSQLKTCMDQNRDLVEVLPETRTLGRERR